MALADSGRPRAGAEGRSTAARIYGRGPIGSPSSPRRGLKRRDHVPARLGLGLGIGFIVGILYVAAWEAAVAVTHSDFAGNYATALIDQEKAKGVSGETLAKFIAAWNASRCSTPSRSTVCR